MNNDMYVGSGFIILYFKIGKMDVVKFIFVGLFKVDIVCWNFIIVGFVFNFLQKEVFDFFNKMRKRNMCVIEFFYVTMLSCCVKYFFLF